MSDSTSGSPFGSEVALERTSVIRWFRLVAVAEAVSWLLLIVATIAKYAAGAQVGVHVMGPIHGALFLAYVILALEVRRRLEWNARTLLTVLAESIVPGGGFLAARRGDLRRSLV
jgi:integral membrane protein